MLGKTLTLFNLKRALCTFMCFQHNPNLAHLKQALGAFIKTSLLIYLNVKPIMTDDKIDLYEINDILKKIFPT